MSTIQTLLSNPQAVGVWTLVPERSKFEFRNKTSWGLMNVKGRFTEFSGEGRVSPDGKVSGRVVIKAASLRTGIRQRDKHLRSADFFDAEHYPDIVVTVNGVDPADDDEVNVRADLTVRGNTVALPFRARVATLDGGAVRVTATTTVDREQFGVSGNMVGMIGKTTTVSADAVFRHT
ncbi:MAG: hypothetical protein QOE41_2887 [Mycobacterium sp.]|jgi:polyisoprenoid-binding protein YceI|nr:hypothetical protein [Mycobacterium sp.]MDT5133576.1 hypothetical protein [Mycobacterium sp.]